MPSYCDQPVIAHVLHRMDVAGAELLAANLARRLRADYRFLFLCLDAVGGLAQRLREEGFEVVALQRRPGVDWAVARRIGKLCRERSIDVLHAHQYTPFFYCAVAQALPRAGHRPALVFTEHGRHYPDRRRLKRVLANRLLLRRGDRVTAVGQFVKDALVRHEGIPAQRIDVIHNGIDSAPFALPDRAERRLRARRELGLDEGQPALLQVARFSPVKDHATSLLAFALLRRELPSAVLLLAGEGEGQSAMRGLAGELGIADAVRFLGLRNDVAPLMAAADAFVLSSQSEGISVTLLEAMAARLPIAATDVGGNGEVIEHENTGLLSPRGDAEALARHELALLRDAELRHRLAQAAQRRLLEHFTEQRMGEGYRQVYDALLSRRPMPAAQAVN